MNKKTNRPSLFESPTVDRWIALVCLILCGLVGMRAQGQSYSLTPLWAVTTNSPGAANIIVNGDNNRSLVYDGTRNVVLVAAKGGGAPAPSVEVLDGGTGNSIAVLANTGVSGGTYALDQVGVGLDGVIYANNLTTAAGAGTSNLKIYRWADTNSATVPTSAYSGLCMTNPAVPGYAANYRVGDTMAVTGSGTNTLILMGAENSTTFSTNFVIFTTVDGTNFTSHILTVTGMSPAGGQIFGLSFYTNNTFVVRQNGSSSRNLLLVQFPANVASLGLGPIACTQLGSYTLPTFNNTTAFIDYRASGQGGFMAANIVANAAGSSAVSQVALLTDPVLGNGNCSVQLASLNYPHTNASNGNLAGAVALGGSGLNQFIYTLDCNNSVSCFQINQAPPAAPSISAQPAGAGAYVPYTLSVTAAGDCPLIYNWQASTNNTATASAFTNIPGANASSFTISSVSTNYYRVIITNGVGSITSSVVQVTGQLAVSNTAVAQIWRVAASTSGYGYLSSSDNAARGIAYDTNSARVVVTSTSGQSLNIVSAINGTNIGTMNVSGIASGGTFNMDQVGIADDGAVYTCNLGYNAAIIINRWAAPTSTITAYTAFSGSPGGPAERYGDNMAIRGAGTNTQILIPSSLNPGIGVGSGTNVVLLTTADGSNFTATVIGVAGVPGGFAGSGIAFDAGNNFWAKTYNGDLFKIAYDPVAGTGAVVIDYSSSGQVPQTTMGLAVDPALSLMSTIVQSDVPDDVQLFQLTGSSAAPVLFHQQPMSNNGNANANAAIVMKNGRLFATDVNNGIIGLSYGVPVGTPPSIITQPANTTAFTNTIANFNVVASGTLALNYQWRFNSNNISGANSATLSITNPLPATAGFYDVIVRNTSGSVTSSPALLTIKIPVLSATVTQMWSLPPGSQTYLDSTSYKTRGLAYDPTTGRLLVADHFNIYLLNATNGADLGMSLNTIGIPTTGFSQWLVDQVRVADDGVVYGCNLQDNSYGSAPLTIISWSSADPNASLQYAWGSPSGADPSGAGLRVGDTMAVRGAGANTQILLGTPDDRVVMLLTNDGTGTFYSTVITVSNAPVGFASAGVAFGEGDTIWAKGGSGFNLRQVSFDLSSPNTAAVIQSYAAGSQVPNNFAGISVDVTNKILAGVSFNDTPNDLQLLALSGNSNPPALAHQAFLPGPFVNNQLNAVTDIKPPWAFALDVNNGITAINYGAQNAPAVTITSIAYAPGNVTINWNNVFVGHSYQVQSTANLLTGWSNIGSPVTTTNATASYLDTSAYDSTRFYRVITQ
jgi:hypothetical protein